MTKPPQLSIPISALWKTPLGWILMLGLASFLGMGGVGIMAGNSESEKIKVHEHAFRIERMEQDIKEIKGLLKDMDRKLDDM